MTLLVPELAQAESVAEIVLTKTVGIDPSECTITDAITVTAGTEVTYCYRMINNTGLTLSKHDLFDDKLGHLFIGHSADVPPFESLSVTATATINTTTTNVATWTASEGILITITATTDDTSAGQITPAFVASDPAIVNVLGFPNEPDAGPDGCSDGVDNDQDNATDCGDSDCVGVAPCVAPAPVLGPGGFAVAGLILLSIGAGSLIARRRS